MKLARAVLSASLAFLAACPAQETQNAPRDAGDTAPPDSGPVTRPPQGVPDAGFPPGNCTPSTRDPMPDRIELRAQVGQTTSATSMIPGGPDDALVTATSQASFISVELMGETQSGSGAQSTAMLELLGGILRVSVSCTEPFLGINTSRVELQIVDLCTGEAENKTVTVVMTCESARPVIGMVTPPNVDFRDVCVVVEEGSRNVTFRNVGTAPLVVSSVVPSPESMQWLTASYVGPPMVLPDDGSGSPATVGKVNFIGRCFTGEEGQIKTASVAVSYNGPDSPLIVSVLITCIGPELNGPTVTPLASTCGVPVTGSLGYGVTNPQCMLNLAFASSESWVSINPAVATGQQQIAVTATCPDEQSHDVTITIRSNDRFTDPTTLNLHVDCFPALSPPAPNPLTFSGQVGDDIPGSFSFTNVSSAEVPYEVGGLPSWLIGLSGLSGRLAPQTSANVNLEAICIDRGARNGQLSITYGGGTCPPMIESVSEMCTGTPAQSWGDPHLVTWDGLKYDLQAVGELVLATNDADFVVQTRQRPYFGSPVVATNAAIAARVGTDRVGLYAGASPPLRVNGATVAVSGGSLALPGGGTVFSEDNITFELRWPTAEVLRAHVYSEHMDLELYVPEARRPQVHGLFGDGDGVLANDLVTRDGTPIAQPPTFSELYQTYTGSWRITQAESLFDYAPGEDTTTFTDLSFPPEPVTAAALDPAAHASAEAACAASGVSDPALLDACVLDLALTGDASYAEGSVTAVPPAAVLQGMYRNDFEGVVGAEWSPIAVGLTPGTAAHPATHFLGPYGNGTVSLSFTGLTRHSTVTVSLDLFIIASWDGNGPPWPGPDIWDLTVQGGATLQHSTFAKWPGPPATVQTFPGNYPGASNPLDTGAAEINALGYYFGGLPLDAVYHLRYTFPHTDAALVLQFSGIGLQDLGDEAWGLDNVEVSVQ